MKTTEKIICDECETPVAEWREDGYLVIRARHHGVTHVTIIPPARQTSEVLVAVGTVKPKAGTDASNCP
jgi:hypothetical protein